MEKELRFEEKLVTPSWAKEILETRNNRNRPLNMNHVKDHIREIQTGKWMRNGEAIKFDWNGELGDGQHRLKAIEMTGISMKMLVVYNVDPEAFKTYDSGMNRKVADVFAIDDIPNYFAVSSIVRKYNALSLSKQTIVSGKSTLASGRIGGMRKFSSIELLDVYYRHSELFQTVCNKSWCLVKKMKLYSQTEIGAIMAYLILTKGHYSEIVMRFFDMLFQYKTDEDTSACRYLRDRIVNQSLKKSPLSGVYKQQLLIKCWNDYLNGSKLKTLQVKEGENLWFK
jgi:hypothetical protein